MSSCLTERACLRLQSRRLSLQRHLPSARLQPQTVRAGYAGLILAHHPRLRVPRGRLQRLARLGLYMVSPSLIRWTIQCRTCRPRTRSTGLAFKSLTAKLCLLRVKGWTLTTLILKPIMSRFIVRPTADHLNSSSLQAGTLTTLSPSSNILNTDMSTAPQTLSL